MVPLFDMNETQFQESRDNRPRNEIRVHVGQSSIFIYSCVIDNIESYKSRLRLNVLMTITMTRCACSLLGHKARQKCQQHVSVRLRNNLDITIEPCHQLVLISAPYSGFKLYPGGDHFPFRNKSISMDSLPPFTRRLAYIGTIDPLKQVLPLNNQSATRMGDNIEGTSSWSLRTQHLLHAVIKTSWCLQQITQQVHLCV